MRAQWTRSGPKHDYLGAHVTLDQDGVHYLGTIVYICPDEFLCIVRHFNGEQWPFNPALFRLEILERTYQKVAPGTVSISRDAYEGFVRLAQKRLGYADRGDITPARMIEVVRAMIAEAKIEEVPNDAETKP